MPVGIGEESCFEEGAENDDDRHRQNRYKRHKGHHRVPDFPIDLGFDADRLCGRTRFERGRSAADLRRPLFLIDGLARLCGISGRICGCLGLSLRQSHDFGGGRLRDRTWFQCTPEAARHHADYDSEIESEENDDANGEPDHLRSMGASTLLVLNTVIYRIDRRLRKLWAVALFLAPRVADSVDGGRAHFDKLVRRRWYDSFAGSRHYWIRHELPQKRCAPFVAGRILKLTRLDSLQTNPRLISRYPIASLDTPKSCANASTDCAALLL